MLYLSSLFLVIGILTAQVLIGGARMLYSIPAYGMVAAAALLVVTRRRELVRPPSWPAIASAALMLGYMAGRAIYSPVDYLARNDLLLLVACGTVYLLTAFWLVRPSLRLFVTVVLLIFAMAQVVVGLIQFTQGDQYMPLPWIVRTQYGSRASGFYICPNHLAGLLEALGMFGASLTIWSSWRTSVRLFIGYLALMCFAGIAITGSRGGYLSTGVGLLAFIILSLLAVRRVAPWQFGKLLVGILGTAAASASAGFVLIYNSHFLTQRFHDIGQYHDVRLLIWKSAWKTFHLEPWTGVGAGMFLHWGRHFREAVVQNDPIYVHNDYLHLLAEYGILGACVVGLMLIIHLGSGFRSFHRLVKQELAPRGITASHSLALQIGALSAIAAYVAHSVVDFNLHIPANALLMAFVFGIVANPSPDALLDRPKKAPGWGWLAFSVPALGLLMAWISLPKLAAEYHGELARQALRDGELAAAVREADAAISVEKKNADLFFYAGEAQRLLALQNPDIAQRIAEENAAAQNLESGQALFPYDLRILLSLASIYDDLGQPDIALPLYERAIDADPNFAKVYAFYGMHFQRLGQLAKAREEYQRSLRVAYSDEAAQALRALDAPPPAPASGSTGELQQRLQQFEEQIGR